MCTTADVIVLFDFRVQFVCDCLKLIMQPVGDRNPCCTLKVPTERRFPGSDRDARLFTFTLDGYRYMYTRSIGLCISTWTTAYICLSDTAKTQNHFWGPAENLDTSRDRTKSDMLAP